MDATVLGNSSLDRFDVLVIGSGAGGAAVAAALTKLGKSVLVLEAGANFFDGLDDPAAGQPVPRYSNDELKLRRRFFIEPDPLVDPRTFRHREADGDRTFTGDVNGMPKTVGGAAVHADVKTPRFMAQDFRLGTLLARQTGLDGTSFADWPVDYDALEPFYAVAERSLGVQGKVGANPFEAPRKDPFPMPPGVPMYAALRVAEAAARLGYTAFPYPTAVTSRPYAGRPACVDCGFCGGFGCPTNAKGSPALAFLRPALLSGRCQLRSQTRAVKLLRSGDGKTITGVEVIDPKGARQTLRADRYVLAASPIEDARLLLLSDPGGPGVGNGSGLVGRNLMFKLYERIAIWPRRRADFGGPVNTISVRDFYQRDGVHYGHLQSMGLEASYGDIVQYLKERFDQSRIRSLRPVRGLVRVPAIAAARIFGNARIFQGLLEDMPYPENRVLYDPIHPRRISVQYRYAAELHERRRAFRAMIKQGLGRHRSFFLHQAPALSLSHGCGTLRFGSDPRTSVFDPSCRAHSVDNLYVADASFMPSSTGINPSLTIAANALRVADSVLAAAAFESGAQRSLQHGQR